MRWLIVGPYPPERGSGPEAAAAFVAARLGAGDTVHAVSPRPSAAHAHLPLDGMRAMWALWRIARAQDAEAIWLRIESGVMVRAGTDRRRALVERAALSLLLRRFATSVLDVGDVGLLPGGRAGRLVLDAATQLVVHRDRDVETLAANGAPRDRIELSIVPPEVPVAAASTSAAAVDVDYPPPTSLQDLPGDRAGIEAGIRARASELRAARAQARERDEGHAPG